MFPIPDGARRRHGAGADRPGHDRLASVPHRRARRRRARASSSTRAAGGVGSLAVQLGHPLGAGPRDRDRLERGEARAGARARRRRGDRPRAGGADRAADRGQRRTAGGRRLRDGRRRGVRRLLRRARAVRADRRLRHRHAASPTRSRTGSLLRHSRAVVGFYLFHCLRAPRDVRRCARRPVRARRARRAAGGRRAAPTRWSRPPRRTSTCASGARPASCCSIPSA